MCRVAAYLGPPAPLSALLYDPPHSLERQAYAPGEMLSGHVNVDGTGVAWWEPAGDIDDSGDSGDIGDTGREPMRYVSERPPWSDPNLPDLARRLRGSMQIAAVRSATPGVPFGPGNVAPFTWGRFAGVHNGWLGAFRERTSRPLAARLPDDLHAAVDAVSDSLLVFLTVVKHARDASSTDLGAAVREALTEIVGVCEAEDAEATLNVVVGDGERIVAVRASHAMDANNPLYLVQGGSERAGATVLASERLDGDDGWTPLDDGQLVEVTAAGVSTQRLERGTPAA